jgi:hypothetical protein
MMINYILLLSWFGFGLSLLITTFVCFAAIMKMRDIQDDLLRLHWSVRWCCFFILFCGLILDTMLNWVVLTILFYEIPHEFLSTTRIVRHKYESNGLRQTQAMWWCENFLTPFDGNHCKRGLL